MSPRQIAIFLTLLPVLALCGVGGKLAGRISDSSGEPLPGVNILIEGTNLGTASNVDGEYFILNIPPGTYSVRFSMIGYAPLIQEGVQIVSDFTSPLSAILQETTLEADTEVVVTAEAPLIRKDVTSAVHVVSAQDLVEMPVKDFKDVLTTQAGFTSDAGGGIHVRGGRTKEILYMIDGVVVRDPLLGDFSGSVNQNAIQELTIISGTFNAEYGQAMSSIVNIVTRDGGGPLHGKLEWISDQLNPSPYHSPGAFAYLDPSYRDLDTNFQYMNLGDSLFAYRNRTSTTDLPGSLVPILDLPLRGRNSLTLGGTLPFLGTGFFFSGFYSRLDSPLPVGADINQDVQLKLTQRPWPTLKVTGQIHSSTRLVQNYSHPWKYLPDHDDHTTRTNDRFSLGFTHSLSEALFYDLYLARQDVGTRTTVKDYRPEDLTKPQTDQSVYFYTSGTSGSFADHRTRTNTLGGSLTWQANTRHQIKSGFTLDRHSLNIYREDEPWVGGVQFREDTSFTPTESAFYLQDKIEFDYLILNLGLRYDHVDPQASMWEDYQHFLVYDSLAADWVPAPLQEVPATGKWSPRLGLAFPITVNTVFHFSYGHFFQAPGFDALTYNGRKDITASLPLVGNPRVRPQKTVAFEFGVKQALGQRTRLEATVWSKDIRDLLSTVQVRNLSNQVVVYANTDYASVKGLDLSLDRQFTGLFGANLSYTLSVAKGNASSPTAGYFSAYTNEEVPHQEYYLSFDQRHDLALNLSLRTGAVVGPVLMGIHPLGHINANLLFNAGSGLPYTPYVDPTLRVEVNSARKPWTYSLDLRVRRSLALASLRSSLFLELTNLTNHENVLYVNSRTGKPFDSGTTGLVGATDDSNLNPAKLGPARAIHLGVNLEW